VLSRIGVDQCGGEFRDGVAEFVFGFMGDAMRLRQVEGGVDIEFGIGV
jgi:hypothetical protein